MKPCNHEAIDQGENYWLLQPSLEEDVAEYSQLPLILLDILLNHPSTSLSGKPPRRR